MRKQFVVLGFVLLLFAACDNKKQNNDARANVSNEIANDSLPSWNDGALKHAVIAYVKQVTDSNSTSFIPPADRIATFDNDGTLWAERPYVQELFVFFMAKKMVSKNPALAKQQPFKALIEKDKVYLSNEKVILQLLMLTHTGTTEDEFDAAVKEFYNTEIYPHFNVPVSGIVYQPQLELLQYLRANGFKTFICTGGTVEFVRGISQQLYGIPKEQVLGTTFKYHFVDSNAAIMREPSLDWMNDKAGKPVTIQKHIGQRPVFACGNEGGEGDIAMLKYSQGSKYVSFQLIVNHNDSIREFSYQEKTNASLNEAAKNKWHVVDMKNDWKQIFPVKKP